jgi:hypothetical protein
MIFTTQQASQTLFYEQDYQVFCTEMERMTGFACQKGIFLANRLS